MNKPLLALARRLHRFQSLRNLARHVAAGWTITQPFHRGVICLDAVEHSWAWTGHRRLEDFDRFVQDRLLELSATRPRFLDIGSSVGVMTLSVLLRNPAVRVASVDPNRRAIALLDRSLRLNRLEARARTFCVAASNDSREVAYAPDGSFVGHIAAEGKTVPAVPLPDLIAGHAVAPAVIKIDVEGYEAMLAESLSRLPALAGSALVIELHPLGFNGMGNPAKVVAALRSRGDAQVRLVGGDVDRFDPATFHQLEALWPNA